MTQTLPRSPVPRRMLLSLLLASGFAALCFASERLWLLEQSGPAPVGGKAPAFRAKLLSDRHVEFPASYKGKLVLVDFWATWCGPCREEIPQLREAQKRFGSRGLALISVSLDARNNRSPEYVKAFISREKMPWDHVYDADFAVTDAYGVRGIPAAFLIDGTSGQIIASGDSLSGDKLLKTIERVISQRK